MSGLSDIEEGLDEDGIMKTMDKAKPKKCKNRDSSTFNNSYNSQQTSATASESRTSGSASCCMNVDPSILELATKPDGKHGIGGGDDDSVHEHSGANRLCGSCCDLVRASIIVNGFYIFKNLNVIVTILLGLSYIRPSSATADDSREYYDDDCYYYYSNGDVERQNGSITFLVLMTKNIFGIFFAAVGIAGAQNFKKWLVLSTVIWFCIDVVASVFTERWIAAVSAGFFVYPGTALFLALHGGRITPENYADSVRYCCCKFCHRNGDDDETDDDAGDDADLDINLDDDDDEDDG